MFEKCYNRRNFQFDTDDQFVFWENTFTMILYFTIFVVSRPYPSLTCRMLQWFLFRIKEKFSRANLHQFQRKNSASSPFLTSWCRIYRTFSIFPKCIECDSSAGRENKWVSPEFTNVLISSYANQYESSNGISHFPAFYLICWENISRNVSVLTNLIFIIWKLVIANLYTLML